MQAIILGMHRSGTSAVSRVMHGLGFSLGEQRQVDRVEGAEENPHGFWERKDVRALNEHLLHSAGCDWDLVLKLDSAVLSPGALAHFGREAMRIVSELDTHGSWVLKDPRMCLTYPYWAPLLDDPVIVFVARDPVHVAASLRTRNDFPLDVGMALWEAYVLAARRHMAPQRTVMVRYEQLVLDPVAEIRRLREALEKFSGAPLAGDPEWATRLVDATLNRSPAAAHGHAMAAHPAASLYDAIIRSDDVFAAPDHQLSSESIATLERHEKSYRRMVYRTTRRLSDAGAGESGSAAPPLPAVLLARDHEEALQAVGEFRFLSGELAATLSLVRSLLAHRESELAHWRSENALQVPILDAASRLALTVETLTSAPMPATAAAEPDVANHPGMALARDRIAEKCTDAATRLVAWWRQVAALVARLQESNAAHERSIGALVQQRGAIADMLERLLEDPPESVPAPELQDPVILRFAEHLAARLRELDARAVAERRRGQSLGNRIEETASLLERRQAELDESQRQCETLKRELEASRGETRRLRARIAKAKVAATMHLSSWRWRVGDRAVRAVEVLLGRRKVPLASEILLQLLGVEEPAVIRGAAPEAAEASLAGSASEKVPSSLPLSLRHRRKLAAGRPDAGALSQHGPEAALRVLDLLQQQAYSGWEQANSVRARKGEGRPGRATRAVEVMVGTLYSGEQEYASCKAAIARQTCRNIRHVCIENLPNQQAHDTLYRTFLSSSAELLIKVDADMVIVDPRFVQRVVDMYLADTSVGLIQMAILDYFSGGEIQGVNAYTRNMTWKAQAQDPLFTDVTQTPPARRRVVWSTFGRCVVHAPDPSPFQAFHFGTHRAIKAVAAAHAGQCERALEQLMYLERCHQHYGVRRDPRLALACIGAELALRSDAEADHVDYTNDHLKRVAAPYLELAPAALTGVLSDLRGQAIGNPLVAELVADRAALPRRNRIGSLLLLLPHLKIFGGVNRFLEIARHARRQGVEAVIAVPSPDDDELARLAHDYPEISVLALGDAMRRQWSAAICGDFSSCLMAILPWVDAEVSAVYLLNGWHHQWLNDVQIKLAAPDLVLANSSYAASCYPANAPTVVAGAVDLEVFAFSPVPTARAPRDPVRIAVPFGRGKPRKRVGDALRACERAAESGIDIELHIFDADVVRVDTTIPVVTHVGLPRKGVAELLQRMHIALCPEEDAGWNNPAAEAMACGVPLVCTVAGTTDFAVDDETALVVEAGDVEAFAAAICRIAGDPGYARSLASSGRQRIASFTWPALTRRLIDTLESARPDRQRRSAINSHARARIVQQLVEREPA